MSGPRSVSSRLPRGRGPGEWSTLPTLSPTGIEDDSSLVYRKLGRDRPGKKAFAESSPTCHPTTEAPKVHSRHPIFDSTEALLQSSKPSSCSKSLHHKPSGERHEMSSCQIPTALVTPLPGTSPPQRASSDLHLQGREVPNAAIDVESVHSVRELKIALQQRLEEPPSPGDGAIELFEKWKKLLDMKDVVLKQKNLQIERQKGVILKLQQEMSALESRFRPETLTHLNRQGTPVTQARLQAVDAENAFVKAQLTDALTSRNEELSLLSKKLDKKEYELNQAMIVHDQSSEESQQFISRLQNEISRQQSHVRELEKKLACTDASVEHHIEQVNRLTKYMGSMPSVEEHQTLLLQNQKIQMRCERLAKNLVKTEAALKDAQRLTDAKELLVQSQGNVKEELQEARLSLEKHKATLTVLEPENKELKKQCEHLHKVVLEAERRCRQELQAMRERHRARFVEATAKLRNQYKNLAKRARSLESQLTKNSDAMMALNSELQNSQGTIGELKTSVSELVCQNQGLLEQNLSLQETTAEAMKATSSLSETQSSAAQQLGVELSHCVEELDSLVGLSMSLLSGKEPSSAMLFGSDRHTFLVDEDIAEKGLESRLTQVRCLRQKIDELRSMISENFASQLSSVCNVQ